MTTTTHPRHAAWGETIRIPNDVREELRATRVKDDMSEPDLIRPPAPPAEPVVSPLRQINAARSRAARAEEQRDMAYGVAALALAALLFVVAFVQLGAIT